MPAVLLCLLLLLPQGHFSDPATSLVPFPLPPGARFDQPLSDSVRSILAAMGDLDKTRILAYILEDDAEKVRDYYTHLLPLTFRPVTMDVGAILQRTPSYKGPPAEGTMKGYADGGVLILHPYYDFARHRWSDQTLLLIIQ